MRSSLIHCCAFVAIVFAGSIARAADPAPPATTVRVLLVGDSTMAPRNGYGDALCRRFVAGVECLNLAKNGRSSGSYRAEGSWGQVMDLLREPSKGRTTFVLIQFGHNDQPGKPGRSTDLVREFPVNLARYADEVASLGAVPVLVTPLTRRSFRGSELQNDLQAWADTTTRVAREKHIALLDLHAESFAAVAAMGSVEADTLAMEPPPASPAANKPEDRAKTETTAPPVSKFDHTHLGEKGADFFSAMVARLLARAVPDLAAKFAPYKAGK